MPQNQEKLRAILADLHSQLAAADELDSNDRQQLEAALAEIQTKLAAKKVSTTEPTMAYKLGEQTRHFEESHPTIYGTIGSLIDVLGQMGI
jgi:hypothetical protein